MTIHFHLLNITFSFTPVKLKLLTFRLEVRLAEGKKKEKSPRFLSGLKRKEKRHSRSLSGSLSFNRNTELIEIFRTQMQASYHCLCS